MTNDQIGGDTDTVCQTAYLPHDPYDLKGAGPSYRQIIDMGDLSRSAMALASGQSGQPGSPHYDDLIEPWLQGAYQPVLWTREEVEQEAEGRLQLDPQDRPSRHLALFTQSTLSRQA